MKKKDGMPELVYWGLWGINSKLTAYLYFIICLILGLASLFYGFKEPIFFSGVFLLVAAFWYYYSIRWVDNHSSWNDA
jgi:hypothetical protein